MTIFEIAAVLITVAAVLSFVNYRLIGLPTPIGVMVLSLGASVLLVVAERLNFGPDLTEPAKHFLERIDFEQTLLHGMLAFLLFAGAIKIDLSDLARQRWSVLLLATVGVVVSTGVVGGGAFVMLDLLGLHMPFIYCLLFGALISPTDPVAVLSILKRVGTSKSLEVKIAGESLFNDGIAVVVFLILLGLTHPGEHDVTTLSIVSVILIETVGAVVFGLVLGGVTFWMLKQVRNYQVEILITLAMTMGGYALAERLHTSAPIGIVVAGLLIGNQGRNFAMDEETREHLDTFWELIDEILNVLLFALIGLEMLIIPLQSTWLIAAAVAIPIVLFARFVSVVPVIYSLGRFRPVEPGSIPMLFWGGLKGGISVAMALSIPRTDDGTGHRELIIVLAYGVVIFSIIVQGLTVGRLAERLAARERKKLAR